MKEKTLVPSAGASKAAAKQAERDILMSHLSNHSKALKLKQWIWEQEKEQKDRDWIYDMLKKRIELEKHRVGKERLDKYFRLTPFFFPAAPIDGLLYDTICMIYL